MYQTKFHYFRTYNAVVFCGGSGGISLGYLMAHHPTARFEVIGSFDYDDRCVEDHAMMTGRPAQKMDLFSEKQYIDYHGKMPPAGWRELTGEDLRRATGGRRPHIVATSAPCQGLSGLLSNNKAKTRKYQALNELTVRCIHLMLQAWGDDPPELIVFENVPRIQTRGRHLLDVIQKMLRAAGYGINETRHDCGEVGGLAQSRQRFLMVARFIKKVPNLLWVPPKRKLRPIRDVLAGLPMPDDLVNGGRMHRTPRLQWKTWVRLALIPPGKDWRALRDLDTSRYRLVPETSWHKGMLGVQDPDQPSVTVTGMERTSMGALSIVDERYHHGHLGVLDDGGPTGTIAGSSRPVNGRFSVADGRFSTPLPGTERQGKKYKVTDWTSWASSVIAASTTGQGAFALEDRRVSEDSLLPIGNHAPPRDLGRYEPYGVLPTDKPSHTVTGQAAPGAGPYSFTAEVNPSTAIHGVRMNNVWRVVSIDTHAQAVTGGAGPSSGAQSFPDLRFNLDNDGGTNFRKGGQAHYGVLDLEQNAKTVVASSRHDQGPFSVADFRIPEDREVLDPPPVIISPHSGCWHRPFTTYELAMLQSNPTHFPAWDRIDKRPMAEFILDTSRPLVLSGKSDSDWRRRIGNEVPPLAAKAIAEEMLHTLELAHLGRTLELRGDGEVWVERIEERQQRVAALLQ